MCPRPLFVVEDKSVLEKWASLLPIELGKSASLERWASLLRIELGKSASLEKWASLLHLELCESARRVCHLIEE